MIRNSIRTAAIGSASALAMAAAGSASAVEFQAAGTTVEIGGYAKLDAIYNVNEDLGDTLNTRAINVGDAEDDEVEGKTRLHARQSRVWITTSTPTPTGGDLFTRVEGDFFGGGGTETFSNSSHFRIRHAYGEWNGILAGQTWSNFMYLNAYPGTVDFAGSAGASFVRQAQIRYTVGGFSIALENPEASIIDASGPITPTDGAAEIGDFTSAAVNDPLPDLTAAYHAKAGGLDWRVSGLLRQLEVDDGNDSDNTIGWGATASAAWTLGGTTLMAGVAYGDGIGRYVYEGLEIEAFLDDGDLETIKQLGTVLAVKQELTPRVSAQLAWGHTDADVDDLVDTLRANGVANAGTVQETVDTVHATLFYNPVDRVTYGLEWQYAQRETQGGDEGDANRLQLAVQYNF